MKRCVLIFMLLLCARYSGARSLELSPQFSSGMVIQRCADNEIWGFAEPGAKVKVRTGWENRTLTVTADASGLWSVVTRTPEATFEAQTIVISSGKESVTLEDVLIGDVWFIGGQSNMQMNFHGNPDQPVEDAQRILLRSNRPGMRLFRVKNGYAMNQDDSIRIDGAWTECNPTTVKEFSVVGYVFGEKIHEMERIPVGLVLSAHGGSSAEAWLDRGTLERFGGFDLDFSAGEVDPVWYAMRPMLLYNKMLHPLLPMTVKGVIWYQGESNVSRPDQYRDLFTCLIDTWRKYFRNPELPFYFVQIAPHEYADANSAYLREAQLEVMQSVPNTGMAVTLDVGEQYIIHTSRKEVVGERLAYWALNRDYGHAGLECRGPEFREMKVVDGRARLLFDHAPDGLSFFGKEPSGFEVAGEDGVYHEAHARIVPSFWGNDGLEVWNDDVPFPVAVRYGFTNFVDGSLFNNAGLPASSFRTDRNL